MNKDQIDQASSPPLNRRQPMVMLVCGETGVGKTYRNRQEVAGYLQDDPGSGKKGRKVLAFDTNDDDYPSFRTISPDHLHLFKRVGARRIRPFNSDGSPMDDEQKRAVITKILRSYRSGLLILDDIDHYMSGAKGQAMIGALCTVRHKGMDILLTHQSIAKITTSEWQNCTWLRLHHQVDDITRYRDRIPKYHLVRIAQMIIDEQYGLAIRAFQQNRIDQQTFQKQKSFFLYVDMRRQKILGCSKAAFIRAAKRFIDQENGRLIKRMLLERDIKNKPIYANRADVICELIAEYLVHLDET